MSLGIFLLMFLWNSFVPPPILHPVNPLSETCLFSSIEDAQANKNGYMVIVLPPYDIRGASEFFPTDVETNVNHQISCQHE